MSDLSNRIVQRLWSYCNVFLKMADERATMTGEQQVSKACSRT